MTDEPWIECWQCAGEGKLADCFEDCCSCMGDPDDPDDCCNPRRCNVCKGKGGWRDPTTDVRNMPKILNKQMVESTLKSSVRNASARAKKKGLAFDLTFDWLLSLSEANGHRCSLTGIPFFTEHKYQSHQDPFAPSIDRLDPKRGYTTDNVRLIIYAANAMLSDWGEELFGVVARSFRFMERTKKHNSMPTPWRNSPNRKKHSDKSRS